MISEKTVGLNVTAELLNWLGFVTKRTFVALGPSPRSEGRVGYDVSMHGGGVAVALLQFKRAYVSHPIWEWRLNRTKRKDQHRRLLHLERAGFPVLYALPFFATPADLRGLRRQLLVSTFWYPPSFIMPTGPIDAHHEVCHDVNSGLWWVQSEERVPLRPPLTVGALLDPRFLERRSEASLEEFVVALNQALEYFEEEESEPGRGEEGMAAGQALLVSYPE